MKEQETRQELKVEGKITKVFRLSGYVGILLPYLFIILSIVSIILGLHQLWKLVLAVNSKEIDVMLLKTAKFFLTSLVFVVLAVGVLRVMFRDKIKKIEQIVKKELPFGDILSVDQLERHVFGILVISILLEIFQRFLSNEKNILIFGISFAAIVVPISIFLYISAKIEKSNKKK